MLSLASLLYPATMLFDVIRAALPSWQAACATIAAGLLLLPLGLLALQWLGPPQPPHLSYRPGMWEVRAVRAAGHASHAACKLIAVHTPR
jgi:hypothetical protein